MCGSLASNLREIEKHNTFARGFDSGPRLLVGARNFVRTSILSIRRVARASPDARYDFFCVSCMARYYEQGVKYAKDYREAKVASLLGSGNAKLVHDPHYMRHDISLTDASFIIIVHSAWHSKREENVYNKTFAILEYIATLRELEHFI